jgi:hypothetical protein
MTQSNNRKDLAMNKKLLLIGGIAVLVIIAITVTAFALTNAQNDPAAQTSGLEAAESQEPAEPIALIYPLTGFPASDESQVLRRSLSVKLENTPEARPQYGITSADVVYETVTEGGITRFNCIFQSKVPSTVGSVRSGRNSDVTIVPQYDALFFMSGANKRVLKEIATAGLADMSANTAGELYSRVDFRTIPHNMFLDLGGAYAKAQDMGLATTVKKPAALEFGPSDTSNAVDAQHITVPFSISYAASWQWNANEQNYQRFMDEQSYDGETNQPITATNVVVLWATYVDNNYKSTYNIDMNAGGQASIFMNGKRIDGTYKSDGKTPPRFEGANGNPIKLTPGNTWFQVINITENIEVR